MSYMTSWSSTEALRWTGFVVSALNGAFASLPTSFNVYAVCLKETFNYTQTEVETIASAGWIGITLSGLLSAVIGYGFKVSYILVFILSPTSAFLFFIAAWYRNYFRELAILLSFFHLLAYFSNNTLQLIIAQIGVGNFPKKHSGKIIGFYLGILSIGKILYVIISEIFFKDDLGGFFATIGVISIVLNSLCVIFHRPIPVADESRLLCEDVIGSDARENVFEETAHVSAKDISRSIFFHLMFWSSALFYAVFCTFMNNITMMGASLGLQSDVQLVCLLSVSMLISRVVFGAVADNISAGKRGFVLLLNYFCFMAGMALGMFYFNAVTIYVISVFAGLSVAAGISLPLTMLVDRFGRQHYTGICGLFVSTVTAFLTIFQLFVGFMYATVNSTSSIFCYGSHCFFGSFVLFACLSAAVAMVQIGNLYFSFMQKPL